MNMQELYVDGISLFDLDFLQNMTMLQKLSVVDCSLSNLNGLQSTVRQLRYLNLCANYIDDISILSDLEGEDLYLDLSFNDTLTDVSALPVVKKSHTLISSYTHAVEFADAPVLIGERINPTGKKRFKEALRAGDMDYILKEGISEEEAGAQVLDVNVGLPEIDEVTDSHLVFCPECGEESLDRKTGTCVTCGFN